MRSLITTVLAALLVAACGSAGEPVLNYSDANIAIYNAGAPTSPAPGLGSLYFSVVNRSERNDSLVGVTVEGGGIAQLYTVRTGMVPVDGVPIRGGATVDLRPGGYHIMLEELPGTLESGDTLTAVLEFRNAGTVRISAPVHTYTEIVQRLQRGTP